MRGGAGGLRGVALDPHGAAHHVLGDTGAGVAVDHHVGALVHTGRVVADVPVDRDGHGRVEADGDVVRTGRVPDDEVAGQIGGVQCGVDIAKRRVAQIELCCGHYLLHAYTTSGSGSQMRAFSTPGSPAKARYSLPIATQSSVSAITAGLQAMASRTTAKESRLDTSSV